MNAKTAKTLRDRADRMGERAQHAEERADLAIKEELEARTDRARDAHEHERGVHERAAQHQHRMANQLREFADGEDAEQAEEARERQH